jgi:hypothetical protein
VRKLLESYGFFKIHECKCGGPLEFWQHPKYTSIEIDIRPERGSFEIWNGTNKARPHITGRSDELKCWIEVLFEQKK